MSGEIVVPETPNWLQGLEEKREKRLKARLGHEAGAGAPCLKCGDKCPGLDLHFWRKACKICRCPKEEHDVPDDDIYGWAQFQLLGSKPNKIKTKIVLPGKKDEVELEWAPKGQKETIDKYLKTLPPEALPVKGSQAAQERKQMLQKQIPIHDIDPSLCHELNEEEVKKMEEYIAHIKKSSVGVGQIVNLSSVIKANLHNISPQEAHIIASRYSKGIPFSEIVKLQSGLAKNLEKLTLNDPKNPKNKTALPNMLPNKGNNINEQDEQNPLVSSKFKDITHPWYTESTPNKGQLQPEYTQGFKSGRSAGSHPENPDYKGPDYAIDDKLLQGTNFDPTRTPSQFLGYHTPGYRPVQPEGHQYQNEPNQNSIPYDKMFSGPKGIQVSSSANVGQSQALKSGGLEGQKTGLRYDKMSKGFRPENTENVEEEHGLGPNYAKNLLASQKLPHSEKYGFENPYFNRNLDSGNPKYSENPIGSTSPQKSNLGKLPGYSPGKYDPRVDHQDPKAPKSMKDLIYSTYDPTQGPLPEDDNENTKKNKNVNPTNPSYDPNITFNTYKHDPSIIKYENPSLLGKNDPSQPLGRGNKPRFVPKGTQQGNYGPGHPNYDPKTGKYIPKDDFHPKEGNYDPRNPGHPYYDPTHPENMATPGYFDPKTGKYVPQESNPEEGNYDPKNLNKPGYFDPKTGKYIIGNSNNTEEAYYDPNNPQESGNIDPKTGEYIPGYVNFDHKAYNDRNIGNFDPNNPRGPYGLGNFDPKTGKYIPVYDDSEIGNFDPNNPRGPYGSGHFDPKTGKYIPGPDNFDPNTGHFDPKTGKYIPGPDNFDPNTGKYIPGYGIVDPKTGKHIPANINSKIGEFDPRGPYGPSNLDPKTGKYIPGPGISDPKTGKYVPINNDSETSNFDPNNPRRPGSFDPKTGRYLPNLGNTSELEKYDPSDPENYSGYGNREPIMGDAGNFVSKGPQNVPGINNFNLKDENSQNPESELGNPNASLGKSRKPLSQMQPGQIHVPEDYLEPHRVNIGAIQDINPEIRAATTQKNPGFDSDNVYSDINSDAEYSPESIREILNNIKLPDCHYCKKPFEENEYAVTVDRANVLFHAQCFKCAGCNQSLADNIYFYDKETNNIYCGRDYAKIKGYPRCSACDELIFTKEYCLAENSTFHLKHFCCFQCDTPLAGQEYTLEDQKPYCLPCFETSRAAKCGTCEKVIKPDEVGCTLNGVHFHAEDRCFRCIVCSVPLMGKKLLLRNEKLYCSHECFNSVKK